VRPDDAHTAAAGMFQDLAFQFRAFGSGLLKAGGDDNGALHTNIDRILDDAGNARGRCHHHDQVYEFWDRAEARIRFDSENARALWVDRIDGSAKSAAEQIPDDRP